MANSNPNPSTRFQAGTSGNPHGRPQRTPLTDELKKLLREKSDGGKWTNAHMVAWEMIQKAKTGDVAAARLLWEYVEGKPTQPIDVNVAEEARRLAAAHGLDALELQRMAELIANGKA